ncbi:MAG: hypothetical protein JWQ94_632 [Tardiphaga sp.]|jgi:hypothetical protein|nr:hypothetical protein [Tardiphaga sp.]
MTQQSHRASQPDHASSHGQDHSAVDATMNFAGAHHHNFGEGHHHKPTKAIIGIGVLVVLSFLFYEIRGKAPDAHASSAAPVQQHQTFASSAAN